jgi:hypothetical protein
MNPTLPKPLVRGDLLQLSGRCLFGLRPYKKKNARAAGDKSDLDSSDVGTQTFGGSGPLD